MENITGRVGVALAALAILGWPTPGGAAEIALDRPLTVASYATGWHGAYGGAGAGARAGWVILPGWLGVDVFAEALAVEVPAGRRADVPLGFDVFMPLRLSRSWRLRPFVGFCTVLSFLRGDGPGAPRTDDVLFGAQAGLGVDAAVGGPFSLFLDVRGVGWIGHDRAARGWTSHVEGDLAITGVLQASLGLTVHLGGER